MKFPVLLCVVGGWVNGANVDDIAEMSGILQTRELLFDADGAKDSDDDIIVNGGAGIKMQAKKSKKGRGSRRRSYRRRRSDRRRTNNKLDTKEAEASFKRSYLEKFSIARKSSDYANGQPSCEPISQLCLNEGGFLANKVETESWVAMGGDTLGMPYGLTSTIASGNNDHWFHGYGYYGGECHHENRWFVCRHAIARKSADYANGQSSCEPILQLCVREGGRLANKVETEAWVASGGDTLGMPYGLTSTMGNMAGMTGNKEHWFDGYGFYHGACDHENRFFVCAS